MGTAEERRDVTEPEHIRPDTPEERKDLTPEFISPIDPDKQPLKLINNLPTAAQSYTAKQVTPPEIIVGRLLEKISELDRLIITLIDGCDMSAQVFEKALKGEAPSYDEAKRLVSRLRGFIWRAERAGYRFESGKWQPVSIKMAHELLGLGRQVENEATQLALEQANAAVKKLADELQSISPPKSVGISPQRLRT